MDPRFREDDEEELGMTRGGVQMTKKQGQNWYKRRELNFRIVEPDGV